MRSSASQTPMPATQRRCTETVAAMARRKRRLAPQRNHTDSVITFYNRDTEKARDKMGNKMKKFRQISTNAHRTGHRRKKQENTLRHAWTRKNRAVLRGTALLRANSPKRRCKTSLSHAKLRLATRRHLCCLALRWLSSGRKKEKTSASSHFRLI